MNEMEMEILNLQNQLEDERKKSKGDSGLQRAVQQKDNEISELKRQLQSFRSSANSKGVGLSSVVTNQVHEEEDDIWATVGLQSSRGISTLTPAASQADLSSKDKEIEKLKEQIANDAALITELKIKLQSAEKQATNEPASTWTELKVESVQDHNLFASQVCASLEKAFEDVKNSLDELQKSENPWKEIKSAQYSSNSEFNTIPALLSGSASKNTEQLLSTIGILIAYVSHLSKKVAANAIQPKLDTLESEVLDWKAKFDNAQKQIQEHKESTDGLIESLQKSVQDYKQILQQLNKVIPELDGTSISEDFASLPVEVSEAFTRLEEQKSTIESELRLLRSRYEGQVQSFLIREKELQEAHFYELEHEAQKYQQQINELQSQLLAGGDDEHQHLLEENRQLRNQVKQLQADLQSQTNQVATRMAQIDRTIADATLSNNQMKARITELEALAMQSQSVDETNAIHQQFETLSSKYEALMITYQELQGAHKKQIEVIQREHTARIQALQEEHEVNLNVISREKLTEIEKLTESFNAQLLAQSTEANRLETQAKVDSSAAHEEEVMQLQEQISVLRSKITQLESLLEGHNTTTQPSADSLLSRLHELEVSESQYLEKISFLSQENDSLKLKAKDMDDKSRILDAELLSMSIKAKEDLGLISEDLRKACPDFQDWRQSLSHLLQVISNLHQTHTSTKASEEKIMKEIGWFLSEFKSRHNQSGSSFSHERSRVLGNFQTVLSYIGGKENLLQTLRQDFEQAKTTTENLQAEKAKLVEQLKTSDKDSQDIIKTLQGELDLLKKQYQKDITDLADARKARQRLDEENKELKQKVSEYEKRIGQLHGKEDIEDRLQAENIRLRTELSQLHDTSAVLSRKVSDLTHALDKAKDTLSTQEKELERLRSHLLEIQEQTTTDELAREELILSLRQEVMYENERYDHFVREVQKNTTQLSQQNASMKEELRIATEDLNTSQTALRNLENVLEQFQEEAESRLEQEIEPLRRRISELEQLHERDAQELSILASTIAKVTELQAAVSRLEYSLEERTEELRVCRLETTNLKSALESSLSQMTRRSDTDENTLDRRMVARLLISYFENHSRRQEVLELMARILGLSEEEKAKVGLRKTQGGWFSFLQGTPPDPSLQGQSLSDLWLEFLEKEAEAAKRAT
eukprot:TRINITY_DN6167_c0_g1_i1.p1 TRINITY_DN6167_c0_g1~~TRINITY_DN6167_c0_g1_i1.p1  ORF type:complete len:1162 (+),score=300.17 TRINITY_DN6167_c0_g1_i1:359-3844(+)